MFHNSCGTGLIRYRQNDYIGPMPESIGSTLPVKPVGMSRGYLNRPDPDCISCTGSEVLTEVAIGRRQLTLVNDDRFLKMCGKIKLCEIGLPICCGEAAYHIP
jgi:hypothetical protein